MGERFPNRSAAVELVRGKVSQDTVEAVLAEDYPDEKDRTVGEWVDEFMRFEREEWQPEADAPVPKKAAAFRRKAERPRSLFLPIVGLAALILVGYVAVTGQWPSFRFRTEAPPIVPKEQPLAAKFGITNDGTFMLRNDDACDWTDIEVKLNPHGFGDGFVVRVGTLSQKTDLPIPPQQFANKEGLRFNHLTHKAGSVLIAAGCAGERRYFSGEFGTPPSSR